DEAEIEVGIVSERAQHRQQRAVVGAPARDHTHPEPAPHGARKGLDGRLMIRRARLSVTGRAARGLPAYIGRWCIGVHAGRVMMPASLVAARTGSRTCSRPRSISSATSQ